MTTDAGSSDNQGRLFFKLCSDHLSIEAIPRRATKIDLVQLKDRNVSGHELVLWTPQFVVLRNLEGQEITLRRDGRMIIRKARTEKIAEQAANDVMSIVQGTS